MPSQDATHRGLSRRALLARGGAAGAAGLALTALGVEGARLAGANAAPANTAAPAAGHGGSVAATEPLIVHIRDAQTGDIEMFQGTASTRLRDRELVRSIVQNWR